MLSECMRFIWHVKNTSDLKEGGTLEINIFNFSQLLRMTTGQAETSELVTDQAESSELVTDQAESG